MNRYRILPVLLISLMISAISSTAGADRALLVGIDKYAEPALTFKLGGASAADVAAMKSLLIKKLEFKEDDIKVLRDADATREGILSSIDAFLKDGTNEGERVFFFYVGHGHFQKDDDGDEKDGLDETIVPHDAVVELTGSSRRITGMITDDELNKALGALSGRRVTAVFDSCHSGTVTRAVSFVERDNSSARTPQLTGRTRSFGVDSRAILVQKAEGSVADKAERKGDLTVWSAVSPTQVALIDTESAPKFRGVFTTAFVEGLRDGKADANGNGKVSNAELLAFVRARSSDYCRRNKARCEMGLTPQLEPDAAHTKTPAGQTAIDNNNPLTADAVLDIVGANASKKVTLEQIPPSPVKVGTKDFKFRITSPEDGFLMLLSVSSKGELVKLFPNSFSAKRDIDGKILANSPITIPDAYYGIRFDATTVSSGTLIAVVAKEPFKLPERLAARKIEVIPAEEAKKEVLPQIAAAIGKPAKTEKADENTTDISATVTTLHYEIVEN